MTKNLAGKEAGFINRDVVVFIFFLFLSFGFWYLNSLGKVFETDIKYSFKFINLPRERVITGQSPVEVNLFLKGPGYLLIKLKLSGKKEPLIIDISKITYKRVQKSNKSDYFIVTSGLVKSLATQLRSGCEITSIKPDTLFFTLGKIGPVSLQSNTEGVAVKRK